MSPLVGIAAFEQDEEKLEPLATAGMVLGLVGMFLKSESAGAWRAAARAARHV